MRMRDDRPLAERLPLIAGPAEPAVAILIENKQRLVTEPRELRAPARPAADGVVVEDRADDVDFLAAVDLKPERLQDFSERRRVRVLPVQQLRHVRQAHIALLQLFVIEDTHAALTLDGMAVEGEVHFLDAMLCGALAKGRLGALGATAEQYAVARFHSSNFSLLTS